jgi:hypothetical protein
MGPVGLDVKAVVGHCVESRRAALPSSLSDELCELAFCNRGEVPDVDAGIDHSVSHLPTLVDVAVQEPGARVGGAVRDVPIVVLADAAVREVAGEDPPTTDGACRRGVLPPPVGPKLLKSRAPLPTPIHPDRAGPVSTL